jgi:hypothetical protein
LVYQGEATRHIFRVTQRYADWALLPFAIALGCDCYAVAQPYAGDWLALLFALGASGLALTSWYGIGLVFRHYLPQKDQELPMPKEAGTSLHEKIDQMLTEARVILPGAQALLGFQFTVTMTKAFSQLPQFVRLVHFSSLAAIAIAVMLLLTPATVHRLTFRGCDAELFHRVGSAFVTIALAPLAAGIALDFYVAALKMLELPLVAAIGAGGVAVMLVTFWYIIPLLVRNRTSGV